MDLFRSLHRHFLIIHHTNDFSVLSSDVRSKFSCNSFSLCCSFRMSNAYHCEWIQVCLSKISFPGKCYFLVSEGTLMGIHY
ncbi:unnamed protein product [Cuscuta campestris]|uniref:Uncharacterized protein n=1 Tax=Cuscuta campestris TaxID=132261 RepID=A0A484M3A7_9ASTE|nr:unnamed protein product [Cuscuta campestris]